jgi:RNA polymerase sigma-70 factor (ECF subfamily)
MKGREPRALETGAYGRSPDVEDARAGDLVARIQAGRAGFDELYRLYFDRVYAYARLVLRDEHGAEDVAQQTFLRVLEALPRYERRSQPFRAWLFVIARHAVIDYRARLNRADRCDPHLLEVMRDRTAPDAGYSTGELAPHVMRLPLAQRQVVFLRYVMDLSPAEIADVLGRSPAGVRQLQSRAVRTLRRRLDADDDRGAAGAPRSPAREALARVA